MVRNHYCSFWLGGFETLEADKHLGWSWMSLMLKDDDLDTELEPMQTCQAGDFKETRRNTFFFSIFGSTVSNQLFISPPLLSLFLLSDVSRWVLHGFLEAPFVCASFAYTQCIMSSL